VPEWQARPVSLVATRLVVGVHGRVPARDQYPVDREGGPEGDEEADADPPPAPTPARRAGPALFWEAHRYSPGFQTMMTSAATTQVPAA
jgi:hypothetical protein